jgi:hypothetical protein
MICWYLDSIIPSSLKEGTIMATKVFRPNRKSLHPNIIKTFERILQWHADNGYTRINSLNAFFQNLTAVTNGTFTILVQSAGSKHNNNAAVTVFNSNGQLVDGRIYYNPIKGKKTPKKAFIGTPIIDASKILRLKPVKKKDSVFVP